jgi:multiple sugar transport system permease protein
VDKIFIMTRGGPGVATETLHFYALIKGLTAGGRLAYAASIAFGMIVLIILITALLFRSVNIEREL